VVVAVALDAAAQLTVHALQVRALWPQQQRLVSSVASSKVSASPAALSSVAGVFPSNVGAQPAPSQPSSPSLLNYPPGVPASQQPAPATASPRGTATTAAPVSFDDRSRSFSNVSTAEILRSVVILKLCSIDLIAKHSEKVGSWFWPSCRGAPKEKRTTSWLWLSP
jgi:hypothetical protein